MLQLNTISTKITMNISSLSQHGIGVLSVKRTKKLDSFFLPLKNTVFKDIPIMESVIMEIMVMRE